MNKIPMILLNTNKILDLLKIELFIKKILLLRYICFSHKKIRYLDLRATILFIPSEIILSNLIIYVTYNTYFMYNYLFFVIYL